MFKHCKVTALLLFVLLLAPVGHAAEFGLFGFDVRGGLVVPTDWDNGYLIGASANVGELFDGLYLFPAVAYSEAEDSIDLFGADLEVTSIAIGAEVRYYLAGDPEGWYFGGGPYLHILDRDIVAGRLIVPIDSEEVGITGVAGYLLGNDGRGLLIEARYSIVSGYDTLQVLAGYGF